MKDKIYDLVCVWSPISCAGIALVLIIPNQDKIHPYIRVGLLGIQILILIFQTYHLTSMLKEHEKLEDELQEHEQ